MLHPIFFIKDKKPAINFDVLKFKLLCPRVVKFSDKLYRMYFSKEKFKKENYNYTSIGSAISKDCKKWKVEKGYRLKILYGTKYYRILSPSIIKIKKSLYRMYFEARSFDKKSVIKSAISHDGLMWKEEPGIRIGESKKFSYGTPYCFRKDQGKYEIFFERRYKNKHDICHVNSSDGVFFDKKK